MAIRSRKVVLLTRREEKKKIKKTVYLLLASAVLLGFLIFWGVPVLGKFADFLDIIFGKKTGENTVSLKSLVPPKLDDLQSATNSATLAVSGFSQTDAVVEIFLNGEKVGVIKSEANRFNFDDLVLKDGSNEVRAKLIVDGAESDFSDSERVILDKVEPTLAVENPTEGQSFSGVGRIAVSGKVDADAQVFANGFLANVGADGKFEVFVTLTEGDNEIVVRAVDIAGNETVEKRKVHFSK